MKVELHEDAIAELEEAVRWYDKRSDQAGDDFLVDFRQTLELTLRHPLAGAKITKDRRRMLFGTFPYYLGYRVEGEVLKIVAIAHTSRRPNYWRSRK